MTKVDHLIFPADELRSIPFNGRRTRNAALGNRGPSPHLFQSAAGFVYIGSATKQDYAPRLLVLASAISSYRTRRFQFNIDSPEIVLPCWNRQRGATRARRKEGKKERTNEVKI